MILAFNAEPAQRFECSRAGCTASASHAITWQNPKIHAADRWKTWLGCDEHLDYLREFLGSRSFPLTVRSIEEVIRATSRTESA